MIEDSIPDTEQDTVEFTAFKDTETKKPSDAGMLDAFVAHTRSVNQELSRTEKRAILAAAIRKLGGKIDENEVINLAIRQGVAEKLNKAIDSGDVQEIKRFLHVLETTPVSV